MLGFAPLGGTPLASTEGGTQDSLDPTVFVSKMGEYVAEGPELKPQFASKLGEYVIEGSDQALFVSKLAEYIVTGPPDFRQMSQVMLGTF